MTNEYKRQSGYHAWYSLKNRVHNTKCKNYDDYGGRGITVCSGIDKSFSYFISIVGEKPYITATVDRIDNNLGYWCGECSECREKTQPLNLRWANRVIQARNRRVRSTNKSGISGVTYNPGMKKWQAAIGINRKRKHLGWLSDVTQAIIVRKEAELKYWGIVS